MKKTQALINNISIHFKLVLFFLVCSVLPLIVYSYVNYNTVSAMVSTQTLSLADHLFERNMYILESELQRVQDIAVQLSMDKHTTQRVLRPHSEDYFSNIVNQMQDYLDLKALLSLYQPDHLIDSISLYVQDEYFFSGQNVFFYSFDAAKRSPFYQEILGSRDQIVWSAYADKNGISDDTKVSCYRKVFDISSVTTDLGIFRVDIDKGALMDLVSAMEVTPNTQILILGSDNTITCSLRAQESFPDAALSGSAQPWQIVTVDGADYSMRSQPILYTDWSLVLLVPERDLHAAGRASSRNIIVLLGISIVLAFGLSSVFSGSFTKRIDNLIKYMHNIEKGDFNVAILPKHQDEIGELYKNVNAMSTKIAILIEEQYEMGKRVKNADLIALQAQINPHFLYNTLDMISWKAMDGNMPEISDIIRALARYYKLSLSRGEEMVPLRQETDLIRTYILLQNKRFHDTVVLREEIDPSLCDYMVPKLLLQPFVENSILHGIMAKIPSRGTIGITASITDAQVLITVEDDGAGMSRSQIKAIEDASEKPLDSYGLWNVRERIHLYCGAEYGFTIDSDLGAGTRVTIRLPVIKENEQ